MEPCKYNDDIQNLKKAVFVGNGQPSLLASVANITTKIDNIHTITNTWDAKMDGLLDFMAAEKALKIKSEKRWTLGIMILSVGVAVISIYLNMTKVSIPEVKQVIQEQKIIETDKKTNAVKNAFFNKEMKSQLSNDTIR